MSKHYVYDGKVAFPWQIAGVFACEFFALWGKPWITWKSVERRSVMASTADIQVNANRGRTTQELHREALPDREHGRVKGKEEDGFCLKAE